MLGGISLLVHYILNLPVEFLLEKSKEKLLSYFKISVKECHVHWESNYNNQMLFPLNSRVLIVCPFKTLDPLKRTNILGCRE